MNPTLLHRTAALGKRAATGQIIFDGNSLTAKPGLYPILVNAALGGDWECSNFGVGGQNTKDMLADVATQIDVLYDPAITNVVVAWEWRNAISQGETAEEAYADCVTYCTDRRAVGFKVIVLTVLPRAAEGEAGGFEDKRLAVSASIRANWATFADALADVAADPTIGPVDAADDVSLYYDGNHMTAAGYTIVAGIVITALSTLVTVGRLAYSQKVLATSSANLLGYWPLWVGSVTVAKDISGNARHGDITNAVASSTGIGDGHTGLYFDGSSGVGILKAGLDTAFNYNTGTISLWMRANTSAVWTDGSSRKVIRFIGDSLDDDVQIWTEGLGGQMTGFWTANTSEFGDYITVTPKDTQWKHVALTWNTGGGGSTTFWLSGASITVTGTDTWLSTAILTAEIGSSWIGDMAHVALWNSVLTDAQIANLARL